MQSNLNFNYGYIGGLPSASTGSANGLDDATSTACTEDFMAAGTSERCKEKGLSVFSNATGAPPDPILGLRDDFLADPVKDKLNLAVGVYRTGEGRPLVLEAVQAAEEAIFAEQRAGRSFKEYLPPDGHSAFCEASLELLLGHHVAAALAEKRVVAAQSISGTGGLHLAARMIQTLMPGATVYLPSPTWPIHPGTIHALNPVPVPVGTS